MCFLFQYHDLGGVIIIDYYYIFDSFIHVHDVSFKFFIHV